MVDGGALLVATIVARKIFNGVGGGEDGLIEIFDDLRRRGGGGLELESSRKMLLGSEKVMLDGFGNLGGGSGFLGIILRNSGGRGRFIEILGFEKNEAGEGKDGETGN